MIVSIHWEQVNMKEVMVYFIDEKWDLNTDNS